MPEHCRLLRSVLVLALIGCVRPGPLSDTTAIPPASRQAADSCPPLADSAAIAARTRSWDVVTDGRARPLHGVPYVSILIDGQRAAWNAPNDTPRTDSGPFPKGPDLDPNDIERAEILRPPAAQQAYATCPGVGLVLITTKSKKWRPYLR